jgi:putative transposase
VNDRAHPVRCRPAHHPPIERYNEPVIVLVTVCTQNRWPVLACPDIHQLCLEVWRAADFWRVGRYVLMPDHIHLFCAPGRVPMPNLRKWIAFWKSRIARRFPPMVGGPTSVAAISEQPDGAEADPPGGESPDGAEAVPPGGRKSGKLWQRDFWDTQMRSREHYDEKWAYVRMNPVRQGFAQTPDDWPHQGEAFALAWR